MFTSEALVALLAPIDLTADAALLALAQNSQWGTWDCTGESANVIAQAEGYEVLMYKNVSCSGEREIYHLLVRSDGSVTLASTDETADRAPFARVDGRPTSSHRAVTDAIEG